MSGDSYQERLQTRIETLGSKLCVGLDPRPAEHESPEAVAEFCQQVIEETHKKAAVFKPNIAFFEAMNCAGYEILSSLIPAMKATGALVVLDAKRGDIGSTQEHYAQAYFENWEVDAVTLSPYMGYDSVEPFLRYPGRGVYLLGVTSNAGAKDLETHSLRDGRAVYELVGDMALRAPQGSAGLVLGLTNASPDILQRLPDVPLLIPGLGAQGGDLETLRTADRSAPSVINVSRGILYTEPEKTFSEKANDYANRIAEVLG